jgi:tryptophan synthase beta chain
LNHVLLHQTIIGLEAKKQLEMVGDYPDIVVGCAGGGSNFAGISFPFVYDKLNGKEVEIYPVEPAACPTMTKAPFVYDHGDTARYTPLLPMHSLGHAFIPPPFHAGGLRYHGMAPAVSQLVTEGILTPKSVTQLDAYEAGVTLTRTEGIIPAPETNHALATVIDEAKKAKEEGKEKVILFNFSGHGLIDLSAYDKYFAGELTNFVLSEEEIQEAEKVFEGFPKPSLIKSR